VKIGIHFLSVNYVDGRPEVLPAEFAAESWIQPLNSSTIFPKRLFAVIHHQGPKVEVSKLLVESAGLDIPEVYTKLETRAEGLSVDEAQQRLIQYGPNVLATDQQSGIGRSFLHAVLNPLVILLTTLGVVSFATGDYRAGTVMSTMIVLGVGLNLIQEARADHAAAKLKAMISLTATVIRSGQSGEISISQLVPGDIVTLAAGDMVPADVRIVSAKDLHVIQSSLTGESLPVEKFEEEKNAESTVPVELTCIAFLGTSVESGSTTGVAVATGAQTYLGGMAESLSEETDDSAFDRGIAQFTWLILRFVMVMVPLVFVINGLTKGKLDRGFLLCHCCGCRPDT